MGKRMIWFLLLLVLAALPVDAREEVSWRGIYKGAGYLEIPRGTTVNGDVRVPAGEIVVDGVVNGSVTSSMGQLTVRGEVNGDARVRMGRRRFPAPSGAICGPTWGRSG